MSIVKKARELLDEIENLQTTKEQRKVDKRTLRALGFGKYLKRYGKT